MTDALATRVIEMRNRTGLGMMECKRILMKEALLDELDRAETIEDLKRVVRQLI